MTTPPQEIDVTSRDLVVSWSREHTSRYDLVVLRRTCPCAFCTELRDKGERVWPRPGAPDELMVAGAELMGGWGLNLRWNDGHETGVYSWDTLAAWCACERCRS